MSSAKGHKLEVPHVRRSEYLVLDVMPFAENATRWRGASGLHADTLTAARGLGPCGRSAQCYRDPATTQCALPNRRRFVVRSA